LGEVGVTLASGGRSADAGATPRLQSFHSGEMGGPYPYRDLGKDIIYNLNDDWLEVTLDDLLEGSYQFDAFLHSSFSVQGDVNIDLTDRFGFRRVISDFTQSSDSNGPVARASFSFHADGINDVVIRLTETPELANYGSKNVVMAGFILVPEPGSVGLLAFGALTFVALIRRPRTINCLFGL
ncbi:MAG: PEP-CTERM sorting domain-containing protein, partial [Patescibacteria group bacterium]|nr:PEP-CTERM sorting domain-containing protein [Patescibacteria group bacterium]